jgi:DNA-binding GntR family transcriptional regulator
MAADPTYLEIADQVAAQLGELGERVVSENELAERSNVSRPTARAALQELERRFLVRRVRGAGTFVNQRFDYVITADQAPSARQILTRAGAEVRFEVVEMSIQHPGADIALFLDMDRAENVLVIKRVAHIVHQSTETVAAYSTSYLPTRLVPDLEQQMETDDSLYSALVEKFGIIPRRAWSRASLELPRDPIAEILQVEGKPPSWLLEGVLHDIKNDLTPVEFTRTWMRADLINVVYELGPAPEVVR